MIVLSGASWRRQAGERSSSCVLSLQSDQYSQSPFRRRSLLDIRNEVGTSFSVFLTAFILTTSFLLPAAAEVDLVELEEKADEFYYWGADGATPSTPQLASVTLTEPTLDTDSANFTVEVPRYT
ncbi:MAG: hypothetical protein AAF585_18110, partial [Verrucomicrobiota bacterium]